MVSINDIQVIRAAAAYCLDGNKVGRIGDVYVDDLTNEPAWVTITAGLFGTKTLFAPLAGATLDGERLILGYKRDVIANAPAIADSGHISDTEQQALIDYFTAHQPGVAAQPDAAVDAAVPVAEDAVAEVPAVEAVDAVDAVAPVEAAAEAPVAAAEEHGFDLMAHLRDGLDHASGALVGAGAAGAALAAGLADRLRGGLDEASAALAGAAAPEAAVSVEGVEAPVVDAVAPAVDAVAAPVEAAADTVEDVVEPAVDAVPAEVPAASEAVSAWASDAARSSEWDAEETGEPVVADEPAEAVAEAPAAEHEASADGAAEHQEPASSWDAAEHTEAHSPWDAPAVAEAAAPVAAAGAVAAAASSWWDGDESTSVDGPDVELTAAEAGEAADDQAHRQDWTSEGGANEWAEGGANEQGEGGTDAQSEGGADAQSDADGVPAAAAAITAAEAVHVPADGVATAPAEGDRTPQEALAGQVRMHPGYTRETIYRDAAGNVVYSVIDTYDAIFANQG